MGCLRGDKKIVPCPPLADTGEPGHWVNPRAGSKHRSRMRAAVTPACSQATLLSHLLPTEAFPQGPRYCLWGVEGGEPSPALGWLCCTKRSYTKQLTFWNRFTLVLSHFTLFIHPICLSAAISSACAAFCPCFIFRTENKTTTLTQCCILTVTHRPPGIQVQFPKPPQRWPPTHPPCPVLQCSLIHRSPKIYLQQR